MHDAAIERADTGARSYAAPGDLYRQARKVQELAAIVMDCTYGARRDLVRATATMAQIAAIAGGRHG